MDHPDIQEPRIVTVLGLLLAGVVGSGAQCVPGERPDDQNITAPGIDTGSVGGIKEAPTK